MEQNVVNGFLFILNLLLGFLMKISYNSFKDLKQETREISDKMQKHEVYAASNYVKSERFERIIKELFDKIDESNKDLSDKLDNKFEQFLNKIEKKADK
jgi:hypothetical protein